MLKGEKYPGMIPRRKRLVIALALSALCLLLLGVFSAEAWIAHFGRDRCSASLTGIESAPTAVVLGTTPKIRCLENMFFQPRLDAAAALYHAGKVRALIVSGDHGSLDYNEPAEMKRRLVRLGVPEERILCDHAGFRTLDSVVRARDVFGQSRVIFVSQRFHNLRAVYLACQFGMEAQGVDAADPPAWWTLKTRWREKFACVKALLDVHLLGTRPRFLGPPVQVPL